MIILTVKATPLKEHKQDFINAFHEIIDLVYAEEGCVEYELHTSTKNDSELFIFEKWTSKEAQENHMTTAHMVDFFKKIEPWFDTEAIMQLYNVIEEKTS
ncbi:putative quinol monooxygenase [Tenacibaculum amylolyticum]|uniref:putative quinol monooxygenase n=1 Tax=Tenacibaculum amylolyticum TaxID=104269 RepID=UPI0038940F00